MKKVFSFLLIGIALRLIFSLFFNHVFDYFNILALVKSQAETGSLAPGFFALKRFGMEVQLYGKIYYQIAALWVQILEKLKLIEIKYIFDNKAYGDQATYMAGFRYWGPPVYQLTVIKLIQFLYDFLLVFFLYKLGSELQLKNKSLLVLFWALNPFFMITSYAMFQADIAMMACLVAGFYFWVRSLKKTGSFSPYWALLFFALGAVLKQLPLLLVPIVVISTARTFRQYIFMTLWFVLSYWLLGQHWSSDGELLKLFFLTSGESTMLLKLNINGVPVFLLLYFTLLTVCFFKKNTLFKKPISAILVSIVTIIIVYLTEERGFFFPQFNVWIMPLLALLALEDKKYSLLVFIPVLGFLKRYIGDIDSATRLMAPTIGSWYGDIPPFTKFIQSTVNTELLETVLHSIAIFLYGIIGVVAGMRLLKKDFLPDLKKSVWDYFNLQKVVLSVFLVFLVILFVDFQFRSKYVKLPSAVYEETQTSLKITKKPFRITIDNPNRTAITALQFFVQRRSVTQNDPVIIRFKKGQTIIHEEKLSVYALPVKPAYYYLFLKKTLYETRFSIEISQENGSNEILLFKPTLISEQPLNTDTYLRGYDMPFTTVNYIFNTNPIMIRLLGTYDWKDVVNAWNYNWQIKPKFFIGYLSVVLLFLGSAAYLFSSARKITYARS